MKTTPILKNKINQNKQRKKNNTRESGVILNQKQYSIVIRR